MENAQYVAVPLGQVEARVVDDHSSASKDAQEGGVSIHGPTENAQLDPLPPAPASRLRNLEDALELTYTEESREVRMQHILVLPSLDELPAHRLVHGPTRD